MNRTNPDQADDASRPDADAPPACSADGPAEPSTIAELAPDGTEPTTLDDLVVRLQEDQARRWRQGEAAWVEGYLERWPALRDADEALDLIYAEILLRRERGEAPDLEDYARRFPAHARDLRLQLELDPGTMRPLGPSVAATVGSGAAESAGRAPRLPRVPGYEILDELGRGSMGVIYRARQVRLNRLCALKMVLAGMHAGAESILRIQGEAEAVARLNHPNIVQIHHIGEFDGLPYLELEYVGGGSLARRLEGDPWPPRRAAALVRTIARAVGEVHRRGIVHRDLKPGNILMADDETPKIGDFGLARSLGNDSGLTRTDMVLGSPGYMAPEQADGRGRQAGPPADVHALGAILYELLTGRAPFRGPSVLETLELVKAAEPVPPSRLVPRLPRDVETICLTCLHKDPSRRYADGAALADDLDRYLDGRAIAARRVGAVERGWRWARRNRTIAALLAALVLAMATGLAGSLVLWRRAEGHRVRAEREAARALDLAEEEAGLRREARARSASLALDRGLTLADRGEADRAVLWLARAAEESGTADAGSDVGRVARANLAALGERLPVPIALFVPDDPGARTVLAPDGRTALVYEPRAKSARFVDLRDRRELGVLKAPRPDVRDGAFSGDGRVVVTWSSAHRLSAWSVPDGRCLASWAIPGEEPKGVFVDPRGTCVVTWGYSAAQAAAGRRTDNVRIWELPSGTEIPGPSLGASPVIGPIALSPDGSVLTVPYATSSGNLDYILTWDVRARRARGNPVRIPGVYQATAFRDDSAAFVVKGMHRAVIVEAGTARALESTRVEQTPMPRWAQDAPPNFNVAVLTPDGALLVIGDEAGRIQLWNAATGRRDERVIRHGSSVWRMLLGPDGRTLFAEGQGTARLYDLATARSVSGAFPIFGGLTGAVFDPDGRALTLVCGNRIVATWDIAPLLRGPRVLPHPVGERPLAFSADGTRLLAASGLVPWGRLWDTATGRPVGAPLVHDSPRSGGGTSQVRVASFCFDGRMAVTAGDDRDVRFWDPRTGRSIRPPLHQMHWVIAADVSRDGRRLLVATAARFAELWDLSAARPRAPRIIDLEASAQGALLSPDGRFALLARDWHPMSLIDATTGEFVPSFRGDGISSTVAFLPDSRSLVTISDRFVRRHETRTGAPIGPEIGNRVITFALSPDGRTLLTGGDDGVLRAWDVETGRPVGSRMEHGEPIRSVAFRPGGRMAAASDQSGTIRFWDLKSSRSIGPALPMENLIHTLRFSPDGRTLAAGGADIRLFAVPDPDAEAPGPPSEWARAQTGLELDANGSSMLMDPRAWSDLLTRRRDEASPVDAAGSDEAAMAWHEWAAGDGERPGRWYSALWHLDRLIAARPADAWLHARRARALRALGRAVEAEAAERKFLEMATAAEREAWDGDEAVRCEDAGDWAAAAAHLGALASLAPEDRWILHRRGRALARAGRWREAAEVLGRAVAVDFSNPFVFRERVVAQLRAGDLAAYRASCARLVAAAAVGRRHPYYALLTVDCCTLGPDAVTDHRALVETARKALADYPGFERADGLDVLAPAEFRAGDVDGAIRDLDEAVRLRQGRATARESAFLALAHRAAGHAEEARRWLDRLDHWPPTGDRNRFWDDAESELLRDEARGIRPRPGLDDLPENLFTTPE